MAEGTSEKLVIVCIDGSEQAEHAFDFYMEHIHSEGKQLLLIYAAEPPSIPGHTLVISQQLWHNLLEVEKEKARHLEEKFSDKMKKLDASGKIKTIFEHKVGEGICRIANEEKAALIVMGTRGLGTVRRTIMGSVSEFVVHHAHCPVFICRS